MNDGLWQYQETGADWLASSFDRADGPHAYLGDDPGLGKTPQAVVAAKRLGAKRVLVVAPASALSNWRRAWDRWGPGKGTFSAMSYADPRVEDTAGIWDLVILDEAHYLKTATAKRSKRVWYTAMRAPACWPLSGTPMPNNPYELYAPLKVLWPKLLEEHGVNSARKFFNQFCEWRNTTYGPRVYGVKNAEQLRSIMGRVMLRRTEAEVDLQLPELRVDLHYLDHDTSLDAALEEAQVNDETPDPTMRRLLGTWKAPLIADVIDEELHLGQYQQIVVFAYHLNTLRVLRDRLRGHGLQYLDGSTPGVQRERAVDAFTSDPTNRVMLMQQTAGGVALNLQCAAEVVLAEPSWVPKENYQAVKRVHRFGQTRPCRARMFAVLGTRDESVMSTNAQKTRMYTAVSL